MRYNVLATCLVPLHLQGSYSKRDLLLKAFKKIRSTSRFRAVFSFLIFPGQQCSAYPLYFPNQRHRLKILAAADDPQGANPQYLIPYAPYVPYAPFSPFFPSLQ
jgi:hypothetical protein